MSLEKNTVFDLFTRAKRISKYSELPAVRIIYSSIQKKKVTSYGIILYAKDTNHWYLIQRKFSPEYIEIICGNYRHGDIPILLSGISKNELDILKTLISSLTRDKYKNEYVKILSDNNYKIAYSKFYECRSIFEYILFSDICSYSDTEWLWPKGKPSSNNENPIDTAKREFFEETNINIADLQLCTTNPIVESYIGRNDIIYETKYWLYTINTETELNDIVSYEIKTQQWCSYENASLLLRDSKRLALNQAIDILNRC